MSTSLNQHLQAMTDLIESGLRVGIRAALGDRIARKRLRLARQLTASVRHDYYGTAPVDAPLSSKGEDQHKLGLAVVPTNGLTLHSSKFHSRITGITYDLCESAGDCVRVCVIKNANGGYEAVQVSWAWKTDLLATCPFDFSVKLGWELQRQSMTYDWSLFRPDVNSNLTWERFAPSMVNGTLWPNILHYGYTKHEYVLYVVDGYAGDGWLTPNYVVAFSLNERCTFGNADALLEGFLGRGGNLAAVTDRYYTGRTRQPVVQWSDLAEVVDADVSDEWIIKRRGVIGDLAFKPRTAALRKWGYSDATAFVHKVYQGEPVQLGFKPGRELVTT